MTVILSPWQIVDVGKSTEIVGAVVTVTVTEIMFRLIQPMELSASTMYVVLVVGVTVKGVVPNKVVPDAAYTLYVTPGAEPEAVITAELPAQTLLGVAVAAVGSDTEQQRAPTAGVGVFVIGVKVAAIVPV